MNYEFIGWCREDNHDKVWILLDLGERRFASVWGRRGKKLQSKTQTLSWHEADKLVDSKIRKGYNKVSEQELDTVYPEFKQDLESTAVWALLGA